MKAHGRRPGIRAPPTGGTPANESETRVGVATTGASRTAAATPDRAGMRTGDTGEANSAQQHAMGALFAVTADAAVLWRGRQRTVLGESSSTVGQHRRCSRSCCS